MANQLTRNWRDYLNHNEKHELEGIEGKLAFINIDRDKFMMDKGKIRNRGAQRMHQDKSEA